jgi:hypothetical protein
MTDSLPFKGRMVRVSIPMRTIHRFTKPGSHVAEIRERAITTFQAIEWMLFVDGALIETRLYHGTRTAMYPQDISQLTRDLEASGWVRDVSTFEGSTVG